MDTSELGSPEPFVLSSKRLGALPIVNHFLDRMGLPAVLERYLPSDDPRLLLPPASAVRLVVANLLLGRSPLYALGEWALPFDPALLAISTTDVATLNDDRVGRALERLFDADRSSLLTELMLKVISEFAVDTSELHNDSTSVSVSGVYPDADGRPRGGKDTPVITWGHSKDHRPDLKQLIWILTVAADGSVPIAYRLADGNTNDDPTHVPTWDGLVTLLGRTDFLYVADSKLCSRDAMRHIHTHHGRFVTVLPRTRGEDGWFRDWAQTHSPHWTEASRQPGKRLDDPDRVYSTFASPLPSSEGHRIIWVLSSTKTTIDAAARQGRIEAGAAALEALTIRLAGPKTRLKTRVAIDEAAATALKTAGATRWISVTITESLEEDFRQERRGRPGADTRYRKTIRTRHHISWEVDTANVAYDGVTDGMFPIISNDRHLGDADILAAYRYQPNLERRHHLLKSTQQADPLLLHNPARIEALFCCHYLALLTGALIEREIRNAMANAGTSHIPLYPELRACTAPSAARILELFSDLTRHQLRHDGQIVQTFHPELSPLQDQVLQLLQIPTTNYTPRAPKS